MNVLGTKVACTTCQAQAVVTRGGSGELKCHGQPMAVLAGAEQRVTPEAPAGGEHYDPFYD